MSWIESIQTHKRDRFISTFSHPAIEQIPPKWVTLAGRVINKSGHRFSIRSRANLGFRSRSSLRSKRSEVIMIYICSTILIWRKSFSAKRFHFAGMRARASGAQIESKGFLD
jgi:hypothetical protein